MSFWQKVFSVIIRFVFIIAFAAFLLASLRHIAVFFHDFEPDPSGQDWAGSYALAWAIDGTALMLTIGMMFFGKNMSKTAKVIVWAFIIGLTGFSWVVNWEYAKAFQSSELTSHLDPAWATVNPILASSFAALNMAYSCVSEFFGSKPKTIEELRKELASLTGEEAELQRQIREAKAQNPSIIERAKQAAIEAKKAAAEVMKSGEELPQVDTTGSEQNHPAPLSQDLDSDIPLVDEEILIEDVPEDIPEVNTEDLKKEPTTDPEIPTANPQENTGQCEAQNSTASQPTDAPKREKTQKIGLSYREAAKLPICQKKGITAADIRTAKLRTFSDGSVSKTAVESWAKTFQKSEEKQPTIAV